jgi:hypothetical protein
MSGEPVKPKRKPLTGQFFSAKYFLLRALAIAVLFAAVHLAGLREYTTFLSGTTANPRLSFQMSAFFGMVYIALYLGVVAIAPILALAAGFLTFWNRWIPKTSDKLPSDIPLP